MISAVRVKLIRVNNTAHCTSCTAQLSLHSTHYTHYIHYTLHTLHTLHTTQIVVIFYFDFLLDQNNSTLQIVSISHHLTELAEKHTSIRWRQRGGNGSGRMKENFVFFTCYLDVYKFVYKFHAIIIIA